MIQKSKLFSFSLFLLFFSFLPLKAAGQPMPFAPGEKLTFSLRWGIFSAGKAVLEVHPMTEIDGEEAFHFSLTVKTNAFIDRIYKVRDRFDAFAASDMDRSLLYLKEQREGRSERDIAVTFDWDNQQAQYANFGEKEEPIDIYPSAFDPMSIFYAFRYHLVNGVEEVELPFTDGKRSVMGRGRLGESEIVSVPAGNFEAISITPDLSDVGGYFEDSDNSSLEIWVTDDAYRIPVRLASKVVVGTIRADLVSIEGRDVESVDLPSRELRRPRRTSR